MEEEEGGIVKLVSKEGDVHEVPLGVAKMSTLIATTIGDDDDDDDDDEEELMDREIPLPNVKSEVLAKVIEYCVHYTMEEPMEPIQTPLKSSKIEDLVQPWYADFVKVEQSLLFELTTAANFMDVKPLLDLSCLAVSVSIKGKTAAELRDMFNINVFSPEEEAQVREESQWTKNDSSTNE
ncbi:unnamed protein product [Pseudo-nitzschia multistriata]|uniref:Uncharacterized protein n=1 Tax=Pseudo-nitzschia multistriata TaxID=183589 RepID=A0A448Z6J5_9STRA|nr:unnamed protein product [Pseudo-nitzschia multistriata]